MSHFDPLVPEPSAVPSGRAIVFGAMLLAVFVFLLFFVVDAVDTGVIYPRTFQETQATQDPPIVDHDPNVLALPPIDFTMGEVIGILADYDVVHETRWMTYMRYYGLTDPNTKTIYINADVAEAQRRETIIHEIVHVIYSRRGYDTSGPREDAVESKAQEVFKALYGPAPVILF